MPILTYLKYGIFYYIFNVSEHLIIVIR